MWQIAFNVLIFVMIAYLWMAINMVMNQMRDAREGLKALNSAVQELIEVAHRHADK